MKVKLLSGASLLATPWTAAYQAPLSMGFPRQEHWSGVPLPSPNMYLYVNIKSDIRVQDEIYKSGLMTQFKKKIHFNGI